MTARGAKHLGELARVAKAGHRAVLLYLVQRTDCTQMRLAADIDPTYAAASLAARAAGLEIHAISTHITPQAVILAQPIPFTG